MTAYVITLPCHVTDQRAVASGSLCPAAAAAATVGVPHGLVLVVAVGVGVQARPADRGHQRVVARARQVAQERNLPLVVITFDPHPDEVIRPGSHPPFLTTPRRQAELLADLGADAVVVLPFTLEFSRLSPDEFVRIVLSERLHAAVVVVGEDFRVGHRATGDVPLLRYEPLGVVSILTPWNFPHTLNVMKVSAALAAGNTVLLLPRRTGLHPAQPVAASRIDP